MAEVDRYAFKHKELVEILVKKLDLHEGIWALSVRFGLTAANMGPSEDQYLPTAVVPLLEVGIQRTDKHNNLTVDAAEVNPAVETTLK